MLLNSGATPARLDVFSDGDLPSMARLAPCTRPAASSRPLTDGGGRSTAVSHIRLHLCLAGALGLSGPPGLPPLHVGPGADDVEPGFEPRSSPCAQAVVRTSSLTGHGAAFSPLRGPLLAHRQLASPDSASVSPFSLRCHPGPRANVALPNPRGTGLPCQGVQAVRSHLGAPRTRRGHGRGARLSPCSSRGR